MRTEGKVPKVRRHVECRVEMRDKLPLEKSPKAVFLMVSKSAWSKTGCEAII